MSLLHSPGDDEDDKQKQERQLANPKLLHSSRRRLPFFFASNVDAHAFRCVAFDFASSLLNENVGIGKSIPCLVEVLELLVVAWSDGGAVGGEVRVWATT
eukprot:m.44507 g.44507  ORF g.44507 m.44507 type:complete len:100 (-) comp17272_c0_seq2:122-421(-)